MFGKLKGASGKREEATVILAPIAGKVIPISEVPDAVFAEEIVGRGVAIWPTGNRVVSPVDGKVLQMFETAHAVTLLAEQGAEILIHVGLDTVALKGLHYKALKKDAETVKAGDVLMEFDAAKITQAGYQTVTPVVICNASEYRVFETLSGREVIEGEEIIRLVK